MLLVAETYSREIETNIAIEKLKSPSNVHQAILNQYCKLLQYMREQAGDEDFLKICNPEQQPR